MRVYILKRLIEIVPTVLMITFVVFVMMQSIPGDPVVALLGDAYTEEDAVKVREEYGLDRPILVQYAIWLGKLVRGDWGRSILNGRPVLQDVLLRLPVTLELIVLSMAVALAIAIPAAIIGAVQQNTWADYTATSIAMIGVSIPEFFIGVLLLLALLDRHRRPAAELGLGLPARHVPDDRVRGGPASATRSTSSCPPSRSASGGPRCSRGCCARACSKSSARSTSRPRARRGWPSGPIVFKHALKNALIPTVTVMGLQVGFLIGGAIVVETLFAMPGLGTFGIDAIIARDYQQVQGFALITAFAFVVINLLVDLTYTFLDPRIRYA